MGIFTPKNEEKEEVVPEAKPAEAAIPEEGAAPVEFEDRSLYNCDACGGDGLLFDEASKKDVHCPRCQGTGKLG